MPTDYGKLLRDAQYKRNTSVLNTMGRVESGSIPADIDTYGAEGVPYLPDNPEASRRGRAENQSTGEQIWITAKNLPLNIGLGLLENVGYLAEAADIMFGGERDYTNALIEFAQGARNPLGGEVYRENPNRVWDMTDGAWWVDNIGNLVESVSEFALTGAGSAAIVGKGVNGLANMIAAGKYTRMGAAQYKTLQRAGQLATSYELSWLEGAMSGKMVYEQAFNDAMDEGLSYKQAQKLAGDAAAATVRTNAVINTGLNYLTVAPLFKSVNGIRSGASAGMKKLPGERVRDQALRVKKMMYDKPGVGGAMFRETIFEGLEEDVNLFAEATGEYRAQQLLGRVEEVENPVERFSRTTFSPEGLLNFALGAIGGGGQYALLNRTPFPKRVKDKDGKTSWKFESAATRNANYDEEQFQKDRDALVDDLQEVDRQLTNLSEAAQKGDEIGVSKAKEALFSVGVRKSVRNGGGENLATTFDGIARIDNTKTDENGQTEAMRMGLAESTEDNAYKEQAIDYARKVRESTRKYNDYMARYNYGDGKTAQLASHLFNLDQAIDVLKAARNEVRKAKAEYQANVQEELGDYDSYEQAIDNYALAQEVVEETEKELESALRDVNESKTGLERWFKNTGTNSLEELEDHFKAKIESAHQQLDEAAEILLTTEAFQAYKLKNTVKSGKRAGLPYKKYTKEDPETGEEVFDDAKLFNDYAKDLVKSEWNDRTAKEYEKEEMKLTNDIRSMQRSLRLATSAQGRDAFIKRSLQQLNVAERRRQKIQSRTEAAKRKFKDNEANAATEKEEKNTKDTQTREQQVSDERAQVGEVHGLVKTIIGNQPFTKVTDDDGQTLFSFDDKPDIDPVAARKAMQQLVDMARLDIDPSSPEAFFYWFSKKMATVNSKSYNELLSGLIPYYYHFYEYELTIEKESDLFDRHRKSTVGKPNTKAQDSSNPTTVNPDRKHAAGFAQQSTIEANAKVLNDNTARPRQQVDYQTFHVEFQVGYKAAEVTEIEDGSTLTGRYLNTVREGLLDIVDPIAHVAGEVMPGDKVELRIMKNHPDYEKYKDNPEMVPIGIYYKGRHIGYYNTTQWISEQDKYGRWTHIPDSRWAEAQEIIEFNRSLRQELLSSGGMTVNVKYKTHGHLNRNYKPDGTLAWESVKELGHKKITFVRNNKLEGVDMKKVVNASKVRDKNGHVFIPVETPTGDIMAIPVIMPTLGEIGFVEPFMKALELFLDRDVNPDAAKKFFGVQSKGAANSELIEAFKNYANRLIYTAPFTKEDVRNKKGMYVHVDNGGRVSIGSNLIGKGIGRVLSFMNANDLYNEIGNNVIAGDRLRGWLNNTLLQYNSKYDANKGSEKFELETADGKRTFDNYQDFLTTYAKTFVKAIPVDDKNNTSFIHPSIILDFESEQTETVDETVDEGDFLFTLEQLPQSFAKDPDFKLEEFTESLTNIADYRVVDKENTPVFTINEQRQIVNAIAGRVARELDTVGKSITIKKAFSKVLADIKGLRKKPEFKENIDKATDDFVWAQLKTFVLYKMAQNDIVVRKTRLFTERDEDQVLEDAAVEMKTAAPGSERMYYDENYALSLDMKDTATTRIKLLFMQMANKSLTSETLGARTHFMQSIEPSPIGIPAYLGFDSAFEAVRNDLRDAPNSYKAMRQILLDKHVETREENGVRKKYVLEPWVFQLFDIGVMTKQGRPATGLLLDHRDVQLQTQFVQAMAGAESKHLRTVYSRKGKLLNAKPINSNTSAKNRMILTKWALAFSNSEYVYEDEGENFIDKAKLVGPNGVVSRFKRLQEAVQNNEDTILTSEQISQLDGMMRELGIEIPIQGYQYLNESETTDLYTMITTKRSGYIAGIFTSLEAIMDPDVKQRREGASYDGKSIKEMTPEERDQYMEDNNVSSLLEAHNPIIGPNSEQFVRKLASAVEHFFPNMYPTSYYNGEGNLVQGITMRSDLSERMRKFKDPTYIERMLSNEAPSLQRHSWFFQELAKDTPFSRTLDFSFVDTIEEERGDERGVTRQRASDRAVEVMTINKFINQQRGTKEDFNTYYSHFFFPNISDKDRAPMLQMMRRDVTGMAVSTNEETGQVEVAISDGMRDMLWQTFLGEYHAIREHQQFYKDKAGQVKAYKEGRNFFWKLPWLNKEVLEDPSLLWAEDGTISTNLSKNKKKILAIIEAKFLEEVEETISDWTDMNILNPAGPLVDSSYLYGERAPAAVKDMESLTEKFYFLAADMVFNYMMAYSAMYDAFLGDISLYYKKAKLSTEQKEEMSDTEVFMADVDATLKNALKRAAKLIAPGFAGNLDALNDTTMKVVYVQDKITSNKELAKIHPSYNEIEATDAIVYASPQAMVNIYRYFGFIEDATYDAVSAYIARNKGKDYNLQDLVDNGTLTQEEFNKFRLNILKPVVVGEEELADLGLINHQYVKMALIGLFPDQFGDGEINTIRKDLENNGVDLMIHGTAAKIGSRHNHEIYHRATNEYTGPKVVLDLRELAEELGQDPNDVTSVAMSADALAEQEELIKKWKAEHGIPEDAKGERSRSGTGTSITYTAPWTTVDMKMEDMRIQQLTPIHDGKKETTQVIQMSKLFTAGIDGITSFEKPVWMGPGTMSGSELRLAKENLYSEILEESADKLRSELGVVVENGVFKFEDLTIIRKKLVEEASKRGWDINSVISLELTEDGKQFRIPFLFNTSRKRIENMLLALINKTVTKPKMPGASYAQVPSANLTEVGEEIRSKIVYTKNFDRKRLKFMNDGNPYVQVIVPWRFTDAQGTRLNINNFTTVDENGNTVLDMEKVPEELLHIIGARIPNQGFNSQAAVEIVGFLPPGSGDMVIVPDEITVQMGSDFDIDKLYTYMKYHYLRDGKLETLRGTNKAEFEAVFKEIEQAAVVGERMWDLRERIWQAENIGEDPTVYIEEFQELMDAGADQEIMKKHGIQSTQDLFEIYNAMAKYGWVGVLKNRFIDLHETVFTNPDMRKRMLQPLDAGDFQVAADELQAIEAQGTLRTPLSFRKQNEQYISVREGKDAINQFALNITGQARFMSKFLPLVLKTSANAVEFGQARSALRDLQIKLAEKQAEGILPTEADIAEMNEIVKGIRFGFKFEWVDYNGNTKSFRLDSLHGTGSEQYSKQKVSNEMVTISVDHANLNIIGPVHINSFTMPAVIAMNNLSSTDGKFNLRPAFISYVISTPGAKEAAKLARAANDAFSTYEEKIYDDDRFSVTEQAYYKVMLQMLRGIEDGVLYDAEDKARVNYDILKEKSGASNSMFSAETLLEHIKEFSSIFKEGQRLYRAMINDPGFKVAEYKNYDYLLQDGLPATAYAYRDHMEENRQAYIDEAYILKFLQDMTRIGEPLKELQGTINIDGSSGIGSEIVQAKTKTEDFELLAMDKLFDSNGIQFINANSLVGYIAGERGPFSSRFTPTTETGVLAKNSLLMANELLSPLFLHASPTMDGLFDHAALIRGRKKISDVEKQEIVTAMVAYLYSNEKMGMFHDANEARLQLLFDFLGNRKLATLVEEAKKELPGNYFLSRLMPRAFGKKTEPRPIRYVNSVAENKETDREISDFYELYNSPRWRPLADALISYAFLSGGQQKGGAFLSVIPSSILYDKGSDVYMRSIESSFIREHGLAILKQYYQHKPFRALSMNRDAFYELVLGNARSKQPLPNQFTATPEELKGVKMAVDKDGYPIPTSYMTYRHTRKTENAMGQPVKRTERLLYEVEYSYETGEYTFTLIPTKGYSYQDEYTFGKEVAPLSLKKTQPFKAVYPVQPLTTDKPLRYGQFVSNAPMMARSQDPYEFYGMGLTKEGEPGRPVIMGDLLNGIAVYSSNPVHAQLAAIFSKTERYSRVPVYAGPETSYFQSTNGRRKFTLRTDYKTKEDLERVILHEETHKVTTNNIRDYLNLTVEERNKLRESVWFQLMEEMEFAYQKARASLATQQELDEFTMMIERFQELAAKEELTKTEQDEYNNIRARLSSNKTLYALTSMDEFASHALTDRSFQEQLSSVPYEYESPMTQNTGKFFNVYGAFLNMVEKLIRLVAKNLGMPVNDTLLGASLDTILKSSKLSKRSKLSRDSGESQTFVPSDNLDSEMPDHIGRAQVTDEMPTIRVKKKFTVQDVQMSQGTVFVFGDNDKRSGKGGTAIIRDESNAIGVRTKKYPTTADDAYYNDAEFEQNKVKIDEDIQKIIDAKEDGMSVVFPAGGIGTGLAQLAKRAPQTYEYLSKRLADEFGFDNKAGKMIVGNDELFSMDPLGLSQAELREAREIKKKCK